MMFSMFGYCVFKYQTSDLTFSFKIRIPLCTSFRLCEPFQKIYNACNTVHLIFSRYIATEWMLKNPKARANSVQLLGFLGTVEEITLHFAIYRNRFPSLKDILSNVYGGLPGSSRDMLTGIVESSNCLCFSLNKFSRGFQEFKDMGIHKGQGIYKTLFARKHVRYISLYVAKYYRV